MATRLWITGCVKDITTMDKIATEFGFAKGPFATLDSVQTFGNSAVRLSNVDICI